MSKLFSLKQFWPKINLSKKIEVTTKYETEILDRFINMLSELPIGLTKIIDAWDTLNDEYKETYIYDLEWILETITENLNDINVVDLKQEKIKLIDEGISKIIHLSERIYSLMGIKIDKFYLKEDI